MCVCVWRGKGGGPAAFQTLMYMVSPLVRFCASCRRARAKEEQETPPVFQPLKDEDHDPTTPSGLASLNGQQFRVGDSFYLPPHAFCFG